VDPEFAILLDTTAISCIAVDMPDLIIPYIINPF